MEALWDGKWFEISLSLPGITFKYGILTTRKSPILRLEKLVCKSERASLYLFLALQTIQSSWEISKYPILHHYLKNSNLLLILFKSHYSIYRQFYYIILNSKYHDLCRLWWKSKYFELKISVWTFDYIKLSFYICKCRVHLVWSHYLYASFYFRFLWKSVSFKEWSLHQLFKSFIIYTFHVLFVDIACSYFKFTGK